MISIEAMGIYLYLMSNEYEMVTADQLARELPKGRKYYMRILKEIRDAGGIVMTRETYNGRNTTVQRLREFPFGSPEKELQIQLLSQYSQYKNIANTVKKLCNSSGNEISDEQFIKTNLEDLKPMKPEDREYFEEQERERQKYKAETQAEYEEKKLREHESYLVNRDRRRANPENWTPADSASEFANLLHNRWDVKPWALNKSRFVPALANVRKKHATNGLLEKRMSEIFLSDPIVQTMKDPEQIWKFYVYSFGSLLERARYTMPSSAKLQEVTDKAAADLAFMLKELGEV